MGMTKFLGNTSSIINWDSIIDVVATQSPGYIGPRHSKQDDIIGIQEMGKLWDAAGYVLLSDGGNAGWDMFFPVQHFDQSVVDIFSNFVNANPISCWISRIHPGNMTPWHWDCNDNENEYRRMPNMIRLTCHISKPQVGHVSMIEDTCLYFQEQGNVWQWPDRTSWHGGINCGFTPKYLFNFFGTLR
jgi:hypothetical protein